MATESDLSCNGLIRRFGKTAAVDRISLDVPAGTFFSILGPSGCGKTTLLRLLAGFDKPDEGDIFIRGQHMNDVPPNKRPVNMVFQHLALFPTMTVGDNIGYGLKRRKVPVAERRKRIARVLEQVGLPGLEHRNPQELSGGQRQRVALARYLALVAAVHSGRGRHGVPDVLRKLQHYRDAHGQRYAAHCGAVQSPAGRLDTGSQCGGAVPDGGVGPAGPVHPATKRLRLSGSFLITPISGCGARWPYSTTRIWCCTWPVARRRAW